MIGWYNLYTLKHTYFRILHTSYSDPTPILLRSDSGYTIQTPTSLRPCHVIPRHTPRSTDVPRVSPCIIAPSPRSPKSFSHHPVYFHHHPTTVTDSVTFGLVTRYTCSFSFICFSGSILFLKPLRIFTISFPFWL